MDNPTFSIRHCCNLASSGTAERSIARSQMFAECSSVVDKGGASAMEIDFSDVVLVACDRSGYDPVEANRRH